VIAAYSPAGGRKGDPRRDSSVLSLIYQYPPAVVETQDMNGIEAAGGLQISFQYYKPDETAPYVGYEFGGEPVIVRGRPAQMLEVRKGKASNVDFRQIFWDELQAGGGRVRWSFWSNPEVYTKQQIIDWINSLAEFS